MNVKKCANGHFFDADKYQLCPHCGASLEQSAPPSATRSSDRNEHNAGKRKKDEAEAVVRSMPQKTMGKTFGVFDDAPTVTQERTAPSAYADIRTPVKTNPDDNGKSFTITPQSILINQRKLSILRTLIESDHLTPFEVKYRDQLKAHFINTVRGLCNDDIEVQYNMAFVSKYRTAEQWDGFTNAKIDEIHEKILPLFPAEPDPVKVKTFDLMVYVIEDEVPKRMEADKDIRKIRHGFGNVGKKIDAMLVELTKLKTIPAIVQKEELIKQMRNADLLFDNFSLELCENTRKELRDLMAYIPDNVEYYIINVKDVIIEPGDGKEYVKDKTYEEKVKDYIAKGNPALAKIRNLDELTQDEKDDLDATFKSKLGSPADFAAWSGNKPLLPLLRVQVGIADEAIQTKFGTFLNSGVLNDRQMTYMNQIISYARENGDITFMDLQKVSPFSDIDVMALFGDKIGHIKTLINGLHKPVM